MPMGIHDCYSAGEVGWNKNASTSNVGVPTLTIRKRSIFTEENYSIVADWTIVRSGTPRRGGKDSTRGLAETVRLNARAVWAVLGCVVALHDTLETLVIPVGVVPVRLRLSVDAWGKCACDYHADG